MLQLPKPIHGGGGSTGPVDEGIDTMRLILFLTGERLGSRHLMLGVETALAMTLCLLLIRTAALL
jgi:hypothetical protein